VKSNYLDLFGAAEYLGLSPRALRERAHLITHSRVTRTEWRFRVVDLEAYLRRNRVTPGGVKSRKL
jgi:hypothetical protein